VMETQKIIAVKMMQIKIDARMQFLKHPISNA